MTQGLKSSMVVLFGLLLGLILAMPLAWFGTRKGADGLVANVGRAVAAVELRQQAMADQALKFQPVLQAHRAGVEADLFQDVQDERSRLAGDATVRGKLLRVQDLEEALLRIERRWLQAGSRDTRLARSYEWAEFGRLWEKQKRLLVREQYLVEDAVAELNHLLARFPASLLLSHKTFGAFLNAALGDVKGKVERYLRLGLDWAGYGMRKAAALVGQQDPPAPPSWEPPKLKKARASYVGAMHPPIFLAWAPLPENDVDELQFTKEPGVDYADVDLGQDPAVLENRHAPQGYKPAVPTVQKTVDYRGTK